MSHLKKLKFVWQDGDIELDVKPLTNPVIDPDTAWELKHGVKLYRGEEPPWEVDDDE